jgi:hypothetical protein
VPDGHSAAWRAACLLLATLSLSAVRAVGAQAPRPLEVLRRPDAPPLDPAPIDWRLLAGLNVKTGNVSPALQALDGKRVKIAAFIVPLEDYMEQADEFLLVPYFGACVHTPPPPPNQMVYVKMPPGKPLKIGWWDPVMFVGVLHVKQVDSPFGTVSFDMDGLSSAPSKPAKP